jgi:hypothetical protein
MAEQRARASPRPFACVSLASCDGVAESSR